MREKIIIGKRGVQYHIFSDGVCSMCVQCVLFAFGPLEWSRGEVHYLLQEEFKANTQLLILCASNCNSFASAINLSMRHKRPMRLVACAIK
jgi:hypothetical protein